MSDWRDHDNLDDDHVWKNDPEPGHIWVEENIPLQDAVLEVSGYDDENKGIRIVFYLDNRCYEIEQKDLPEMLCSELYRRYAE